MAVLYYNVKFSPKVQSSRDCFCINKTKLLLKSVMSICIWLWSQVDCNYIISILYLSHVIICLCDHTIIPVYAMLSYACVIIPSYRSMPCYHMPVWLYHTCLTHVVIWLCDYFVQVSKPTEFKFEYESENKREQVIINVKENYTELFAEDVAVFNHFRKVGT